MLTRELLTHRVRNGAVKPSFIVLEDPALLSMAAGLIARVEDGIGEPRGELESGLQTLAGGTSRPKIARGFAKLLLDRVEEHEPGPELAEQRMQALLAAAQVRRGLPPDASFEHYEAALSQALPVGLDEVRSSLYDDLPAQRPVRRWRKLGAAALLERYNLAQAQGLILQARRLTVRTTESSTPKLRRVLRHLKFCRLVAEVRPLEPGVELTIEGPGAVLSLQKKYGLQLASFLGALPLLSAWQLDAEVKLLRGWVTLHLSEKDPLVSPFGRGVGYVPPEVQALADAFPRDGWSIETSPLPRHVGARGTCLPDFLFHHEKPKRTVALELFHPWHAGALTRRLQELAERPDPALILGVDRALPEDASTAAALEAQPRVFLFRAFPSATKLLPLLEKALS